MQSDDKHPMKQHDQISNQVSAAGLQGFTVQRLALTGQTDHSNLSVGEDDAADGGREQDDGEREAVDVIDEHALAGELKDGGVVTVRIHDHGPAAVQPYGQTEQNPDQNKGHSPGRNRQLDHHPVGHYGGIAQGVADGHVSVEGHDHKHRVGRGAEQVRGESLNHTLIITNEELRGRPQQV